MQFPQTTKYYYSEKLKKGEMNLMPSSHFSVHQIFDEVTQE
jgi:hypothetical protein